MQIVLMYHDVYRHDVYESGFQRDRDLPYKIEVSAFEEQVQQISLYCEKEGIAKEDIVFSVDDGGKSSLTVIAPVLDKYGFKGLFFVSTQYIGTDTFLSEEEIKKLHALGHIVGSHAHTHEHMYLLTDEQIDAEWKTSTQCLNQIIGSPITYASIPNGDASKRVLTCVEKYGIKNVYTSNPTTNVSHFGGMNVIGRYVILADMQTKDVLALLSSRNTRRMLTIKHGAVLIVKRILGKHYVCLKYKLVGK